MKEDYIEVSIDSPSPIDFSNGDYIIYDYNGIKYTLSDPIGVKKQARKDTYPKAFVYTGIKFNSNFNLLFRCMFLDIVQEDNLNHYTSLPDVDTFEDVYGIAGRIQANLDNQYPNTFNIKIVDTTGNAELESILRTARAFNVSNGYCSDALSTIYDQWGVGYIYTVENGKDTIIIGGTAGESTVFRYGKNNGLRVITSDIQNLSELCNRIFPFGSTRNLPARWYNKKQYIQDLQYAPNLLIPKSKWGDNNPRSAFVENTESINKYGLRPKAIYWDGSDSDRIEIYPSIEGVTAGIIRQAKAEAEDTTYVPSTELYPDDELVDEILVGDNIEDDGLNIDTGYKLYSEQYAYAYNAEEGKDFETSKIGIIGKDGAELGFSFTFEIPNQLNSFTLPKDAVYRIGSPDYELEVIGYNTLPHLYIPRTYAKGYATYLFSQNHPAYLVGRAEGTNDFWRWECSIEESDSGFTIKPIVEQTISLKAGSSLFFLFELSASILFSDSYAIEHLNEEVFVTCYIRGGGFYIQRGLNYIFPDFNIYIKQIGFNMADYPSEDNNYITININTGSCAGRSFKVKKVEYDSVLDRWKLNCYRSDDNTLSLRFPNSDFHISAGDKFVITNIQMPDLYVYMAMERLYSEALKELGLLSHPSRIYIPEIDNLQMARSPQVLRAGMFMPISDDNLNIQSDNAILIDSIEISEGENPIRTFSVTLRNEKQDNILKKNKRGIKSISVALKKSNTEASRVSSNESVNQDSTGVTGGGTTITSYTDLTNKPSINEVELNGSLTSKDLGLQPAGDYVSGESFNAHANNKDIHINSDERTKWNNKWDYSEETIKKVKVNSASSADKLSQSHNIFGQPFNGEKDVDGGFTANGDSKVVGKLNVTKDIIANGEVIAIAGDAAPVGVTDYAQLTGKPKINGIELASGNNTLAALGIQPKGDYATKSALNGVTALIPSTATSSNQLTDKAFVNSSIATATAEFRGTFISLAELQATSGDANDYAFYQHKDELGNTQYDRYKWTSSGWVYEYTLNNSSFTAAQWSAINSGITAAKASSYDSHLSDLVKHITSAERTAWNAKWDYNEETIKGVKVNAAVLADTATKLATPRTIWGQPFDGSVDVSGAINGVSYLKSGDAIGDFYIGDRNAGLGVKDKGLLFYVYGTRPMSFYTGSSSRIEIASNGYVGIGTTSPFYKLDVNGNGHFVSKLSVDDDIICGGEVVAVAGEAGVAGVSDYAQLTGKPKINGVELAAGNNTLAQLGIQAAGSYAAAEHTHLYAGSASVGGDATRAIAVADYGDTNRTISIGYAGTGLSTTSVTCIAGYTDGGRKIKDVSKAVLQSWLGLGSAAYTESTAYATAKHTHNYLPYEVTSVEQNTDEYTWIRNYAISKGKGYVYNYNGLEWQYLYGINDGYGNIIRSTYGDGTPKLQIMGYYRNVWSNWINVLTELNYSTYAATKDHTHTFASLTSKPTTLAGYGITDAYTSSTIDSKLSGYLPLSGGTITGLVTYANQEISLNGLLLSYFSSALRVRTQSGDSYFGMMNGGYCHIYTEAPSFYMNKPLYVDNGNAVIHSGNYNAYAPTLTGGGASGTWGINITGNAASATKLATPRTLWGQSFDGGGDVNGQLNIITSKVVNTAITNSASAIMLGSSGSGHTSYHAGISFNALRYGYYINHQHAWIGLGPYTTTEYAECYPLIFATNESTVVNTPPIERMRITPNGYVGIGTTSPRYKFDVNGTGHFAGDLIVDGEVVAVAS